MVLLNLCLISIQFCLQNISDEKFEQLCNALPENEHLEVLSLTNVGLTDRNALLLAEAIEKNKTLRVLNVETNFISPAVIVTLVRALLKSKSIEEFRATNQVFVWREGGWGCGSLVIITTDHSLLEH